MFVHVVLFWLKKGTPDSELDAMIADAQNSLAKIPSVTNLWAGRPHGSSRDVVDSSYDVGLCVTFADPAAHDKYQDHESHRQFLKRHGKSWDCIKVYDFK